MRAEATLSYQNHTKQLFIFVPTKIKAGTYGIVEYLTQKSELVSGENKLLAWSRIGQEVSYLGNELPNLKDQLWLQLASINESNDS